ncbi:MAG: hypothetical protein LBP72_02410 [Dysgonamonadaceae bacterium]|jgi:hypothetical protein|nr:hypothetical protein [Dysgonamonadaceae bacterium]
MIFSKQKWETEREGLDYLKVSTACSWNTVKSPLRNAWDLFLVPLIGEEMGETLTEIYHQAEMPAADAKLLRLAQRANILLAFWYDYAELNVMIADSGFKRQESEDTRTPYKYQERQLRTGWKTKGFNALDDLLAFLEKNSDDYPEYKNSDNYTESRRYIVQNAAQVNEYYFINHSRLTYLRLQPHFKIIEETILAPRMNGLYQLLKIELEKEAPEQKWLELRNALRPVVVYYAVHRLLLETGDLTDKGLFFASLKNDDSDAEERPVADERIVHQAKQAEADAISYWKLAEKLMQKYFGIEPASAGFHRRDNKDKKSFWA